MTKRVLFLLLLLFAVIVDARSADFLGEEGLESFEDELGSAWSSSTVVSEEEEEEEQELGVQREEALEKLKKIFGVPGQSDRSNRRKTAPQFMMELYNTIADPGGVTRGKNPYDAKVVRSFIERDSSTARFYKFNISGLEMNESVLGAELHLYRKRTPLKQMHPSILSSPYYLIRVYQVLDDRSLDVPDLHRLLNVHYVGAYASGWQVFNVKQAVLSWVSGTPNRGLLVTASTVFGDEVSVDFARRNDNHRSKQPILVLFDDDDDDDKERLVGENLLPHYYKYDNDLEDREGPEKIDMEEEYGAGSFKRHKREKGQPEEAKPIERDEPSSFRRQKRPQGDIERPEDIVEDRSVAFPSDDYYSEIDSREAREARTKKTGPRKKFVSPRPSPEETITSMDIYERATVREKLSGRRRRRRELPHGDEGSDETRERRKRSPQRRTHAHVSSNTTECARHELYVDFEEIGWASSIIAPAGYSAYHCKGHCNFPLSQRQHPTNHATVQNIVHKLGLAKSVEEPCCVPTKLLRISLLYFSSDENVVLKTYADMVAESCGCR